MGQKKSFLRDSQKERPATQKTPHSDKSQTQPSKLQILSSLLFKSGGSNTTASNQSHDGSIDPPCGHVSLMSRSLQVARGPFRPLSPHTSICSMVRPQGTDEPPPPPPLGATIQ